MKMRELAVVSSSVNLMAVKQDHDIAPEQSICPKNLAAFRSLLTSSRWTISYYLENISKNSGEYLSGLMRHNRWAIRPKNRVQVLSQVQHSKIMLHNSGSCPSRMFILRSLWQHSSKSADDMITRQIFRLRSTRSFSEKSYIYSNCEQRALTFLLLSTSSISGSDATSSPPTIPGISLMRSASSPRISFLISSHSASVYSKLGSKAKRLHASYPSNSSSKLIV